MGKKISIMCRPGPKKISLENIYIPRKFLALPPLHFEGNCTFTHTFATIHYTIISISIPL